MYLISVLLIIVSFVVFHQFNPNDRQCLCFYNKWSMFPPEYIMSTYFRHVQFAKEDDDFSTILRYYFLIQSRYLLHMVCIFLIVQFYNNLFEAISRRKNRTRFYWMFKAMWSLKMMLSSICYTGSKIYNQSYINFVRQVNKRMHQKQRWPLYGMMVH